jgi:branched-subunit amino acid transport protein
MSSWEAFFMILGLAAVTVLTRGFFLLPRREFAMPPWLRQGLRYAPLAALMAVVAPEVVLTGGQLVNSWQEPRLFAAAAGVAHYFWRRGMLGTIVVGMLVFAGLRFGLGW